MNAIQNVLRSHQILHICKTCSRTILYRIRDQIRYFSSLNQSRYNVEEEKQILQVLNESSAEEMSRFNVSKDRINSLQRYRRKRGQFCTLDDVLEVDGLGVKVLERLCDSILRQISGSELETSVEMAQAQKKLVSPKNKRSQMLTPTLQFNQKRTVESVVGIHIGVSALTWAHVDYSGKLLHWDLCSLEFGNRKLHVTALFQIVQGICERLPKGDLFVMEDNVALPQSLQQTPASVSINLQTSQLTAMLVALLNNAALSEEESSSDHEHHVFFLRSQLPARMFGILVGAERVSAQTVVLDIISEVEKNSAAKGSNRDVYTPISVDQNLTERYLNRTSVEKESLCWGLLLTIAFMDLILHQNPHSLRAISARKS